MSMEIQRLNPTNFEDFIRLHQELSGFCPHGQVAAWADKDWARTTSPCLLQEEFFDHGRYYGYLLFVDEKAVGWCQAAPEKTPLDNLLDSGGSSGQIAWHLTCFHIRKDYIRLGIARFMIDEILVDLRERGIKRVEATRVLDSIQDSSNLWLTPEVFRAAGLPVKEEIALPLFIEKPDPEGD